MIARARGFALLELLIALVVLTIVGGAVHAGMVRQQRVFRSLAIVLAARGDLRDGAEVLASDLAAAAISDTLALATDSAVEFFAVIGSSAVSTDATGATVSLPREERDDPAALTSLLFTPDTGDVVALYRQAGEGGAWIRRRVRSFGSSGETLTVGLDVPVDSLPARSPVRFLRRGRYSLYRSSDGDWYLGYRRCNATSPPPCGVIQPVSGPYDRYAARGLELRYFDSTGVRIEGDLARTAAARIELVLRTRPNPAVRLGRTVTHPYADSLVTTVAFRP